jgi:hypothetical protein
MRAKICLRLSNQLWLSALLDNLTMWMLNLSNFHCFADSDTAHHRSYLKRGTLILNKHMPAGDSDQSWLWMKDWIR